MDSILWDNVVIEENASLDGCIIANNVKIKAGVSLDKNSIVPQDVVITKPEDLYKETANV